MFRPKQSLSAETETLYKFIKETETFGHRSTSAQFLMPQRGGEYCHAAGDGEQEEDVDELHRLPYAPGAGFNGRVNGFMRVDSSRPVADQ